MDPFRQENAAVRYTRVAVIVNPASGRSQPVLNTLNATLGQQHVDWEVSVTKGTGDAFQFAKAAVREGAQAVAVYGGDGTVMEVARGLVHTGVPMAILPGGTGNALAIELGIPLDLRRACGVLLDASSRERSVDIGKSDHGWFIVRVAVGLLAEIGPAADRELKSRLGRVAYPLSALRHMGDQEVARYRLTLDGTAREVEGVLLTVLNAGTLGVRGLTLSEQVDVSDGWFDVVVLSRANLAALVDLASSTISGQTLEGDLQHWQARRIEVDSTPLQAVTFDGEEVAPTPFRVEVVPRAVRVLAPAEEGNGDRAS